MSNYDIMYLCIIVLTELMMLAAMLHVIHYTGFKKEQKAWYIITFGAIMFCAAAEYSVHCGFYDQKFAIPLTFLTVLQFSVAPMLAVLFIGALGNHRQTKFTTVFFFLNLTVETLFAPFGLIFYYDASGYHRGDLFIVYTAFYIVSMLYLIAGMIRIGKSFRHRDVVTIIMIIVILIAGIIPMSLKQINVTYMAIALSASLCYIYYNDLVQQDIQAELRSNQEKISGMQSHLVSGLANLIENRDMDTGGHITRTGAIVKTLAQKSREVGVYSDEISDHFIMLLSTLAPMHDIGKIVVSDTILKKPGRLTPEEFEEMKKHAEVGGKIVREVLDGITDEEYLKFASDIATYHHEKWDGTGYPCGLKGEEIPLSARIMAIADVFDALVSERCYKKPVPPDEAFCIIRDEAGSHFDPMLVSVFLAHREVFLKDIGH